MSQIADGIVLLIEDCLGSGAGVARLGDRFPGAADIGKLHFDAFDIEGDRSWLLDSNSSVP